ncbi:MAG: hypothetical protein NTV43_00320 [Methylococcales bacterium]|nr:hypothetical protein [Methylococcales bacterium]
MIWHRKLSALMALPYSHLAISVVVFAFLFSLTGCFPEGYYRTQISSVPCRLNCDSASLIVNSEHEYALGFVELDDQGQFYDRGQVEVLLNWLKQASQPQYVILFVHGWHHNANDNDFNVRRFKDALKDVKTHNPGHRVTGIYVGWRGETFSVPWLRALTFWDRKQVSEEVGRNALLDFLLRVEALVKSEPHTQNRLLSVGHSLGASVLFNALHPVLLQRLVQPVDHSVRSGYGDLVVFVNPAFEAMRFSAIRAAAQRYSQEFGYSRQQNPLLMVATSEADTTTKNTFAFSRTLTAVFEEHRFIDPTLSEWELDTTAVGHFNQYITHRLKIKNPMLTVDNCTANPVGLGSVSTKLQPQTQGDQTGFKASVLSAAFNNLELQHLQNSAPYDPYWVIQADKSILPSHGFVNQKPLWCFIDAMVNRVQLVAR